MRNPFVVRGLHEIVPVQRLAVRAARPPLRRLVEDRRLRVERARHFGIRRVEVSPEGFHYLFAIFHTLCLGCTKSIASDQHGTSSARYEESTAQFHAGWLVSGQVTNRAGNRRIHGQRLAIKLSESASFTHCNAWTGVLSKERSVTVAQLPTHLLAYTVDGHKRRADMPQPKRLHRTVPEGGFSPCLTWQRKILEPNAECAYSQIRGILARDRIAPPSKQCGAMPGKGALERVDSSIPS